MAKILVHSNDADHSLFHAGYSKARREGDTNPVISSNQMLLDKMKKQQTEGNYSKVIMAIGSNRQDYAVDYLNSHNNNGVRVTESVFSAIESIATHLGAEYDPTTMADITKSRPDGVTAYLIQENKINDPNSPEWVFDNTKTSILYAQMQKVANAHPGDEITYNFYDDNTDILASLQTIFKKFPHLIPNNVTLQLHTYNGSLLTDKAPIAGTGRINADYRNTVNNMGTLITSVSSARSPQNERQLAPILTRHLDDLEKEDPKLVSLYTDKQLDRMIETATINKKALDQRLVDKSGLKNLLFNQSKLNGIKDECEKARQLCEVINKEIRLREKAAGELQSRNEARASTASTVSSRGLEGEVRPRLTALNPSSVNLSLRTSTPPAIPMVQAPTKFEFSDKPVIKEYEVRARKMNAEQLEGLISDINEDIANITRDMNGSTSKILLGQLEHQKQKREGISNIIESRKNGLTEDNSSRDVRTADRAAEVNRSSHR